MRFSRRRVSRCRTWTGSAWVGLAWTKFYQFRFLFATLRLRQYGLEVERCHTGEIYRNKHAQSDWSKLLIYPGPVG